MTNTKQRTINQKVTLKGVGLHTGENVTMSFLPAKENHGFAFKRVDLEGEPIIEANAAYVVNTQRGTNLEKNGGKIQTSEHVLAALTGLDIDNVLIEGSGFTPPTCSFTFGSNSGTCNAFTSGTDTYTATFNFSGAGNGDYTVTSDFGTVVLDDDPDSDATGSFRVTGVPEGTDVTATVNVVNCTNITSTVTAPTCAQPAP